MKTEVTTDEALAEVLAEANSEPGTSVWKYLANSERAEWVRVARQARAVLAAGASNTALPEAMERNRDTRAAPATVVPQGEYPQLPEASYPCGPSPYVLAEDAWSADQMHAYYDLGRKSTPVANPAWDKTRDSLAMLLLGLARNPNLSLDVACIALDAATAPDEIVRDEIMQALNGSLEAAPQQPAAPVASADALLKRATDLHEKGFMPWTEAEELALSEIGIEEAAIDELIRECSHRAVDDNFFLTGADEIRAFMRAALVHQAMLHAISFAPAAPATPNERGAEISGLTASVGHLSALVDGQHALLEKAKATMTALHGAASPIDESRGDFDARIPASAFASFVDGHAELLHAMAQSPVAAPAAPAVTAADAERLDWLRHNAEICFSIDYNRIEISFAAPKDFDEFKTIEETIDAARAAQAVEDGLWRRELGQQIGVIAES